MKFTTSIIISIFSMVSFAANSDSTLSVGFTGGSQFESRSISGQIQIQCQEAGQFETRYSNCYGLLLLPYEYDYFVGPKGVDADTVQLTSVQQDGTSRSKSSGYDSVKARSTSRFNLWIRSLTQAPLLDEGLNTVTYKLNKNGVQKATGQFQVRVIRGTSAQCRDTGYYSSSLMSDCRNPGFICDRYFQERNFCL